MNMEGRGCCSCVICRSKNVSSEDEKKDDKKVYLAVFLVQTMYAGMILLSKAVFVLGMKSSIFVFYRMAFATVFLTPLAIYFEWKKAPPLSLKTFCKIFMLSFFGITLTFNVYNIALDYTTATLASTVSNGFPVITFFVAVLFRMEKWKLKTIPGRAKLVGIVICIGGVLVLGLYKGFLINLFTISHQFHVSHTNLYVGDDHHHSSSSPSNIWMKGFSLMVASNFLFSFWIVLQTPVMKLYPSKLLYTTLSIFLSSVQSLVIAIIIERDLDEWKLGWNLRLISVAYCGIIVTGVSYYLQAYIIKKKGPVFLAMWTPLCFVITVVFSSLLLGEIISMGSIIGTILLVGGLYCVLWAKREEAKELTCTNPQAILSCDDVATNTTTKYELQQDMKEANATTHVVLPIGITHDEVSMMKS